MLTKLKHLLGSSETVTEAGGDLAPRSAAVDLADRLHYEIVPMKSIEQAIEDLPPGANVSVTCSPVKGIAATQEYTERLLASGHRPVPHLAARLVESREHVADLAAWLREHNLPEVFVIAGDAPEPAGPYDGATAFIADLLEDGPAVDAIGITGYPDGHASIDASVVHQALHDKQRILAAANVAGWVSTQMCFDTDAIKQWILTERRDGLTLPIRLGVPGVVDRARLMKMGTRLGIGTSMRYLSKNRSTVMKLMAPGGYDPTELVEELAVDRDELGIEALHSFTFNAVAETRAWQEAILGTAPSR